MDDNTLDHIVQKQIFDLTITDEQKVHEIANEVERIYNNYMIPLLDKIFSEHDIPGHIIRIDRLEIDLGRIDPGDIEFTLVKAFEKALVRELTAILEVSKSAATGSSVPEIIPYTPARIELLEHFLKKGRFSTLSQLKEVELDPLVLELIQDSPAELKRLLVTQARRSFQSVRRLVLQFSEPVRHRLYEFLMPQHATYIREKERQWKEASRKVSNVSQGKFQEVIAHAILRYLLSSPALVFDRKEFNQGLQEFVEANINVPLAPLYAALPEEPPPDITLNTPFDFIAEGKTYAQELDRIAKWLPTSTVFHATISEQDRVQTIADLLLNEHPKLLVRLFHEPVFAENKAFIRELTTYLIFRKWTQFRTFLRGPVFSVAPEAAMPVMRLVAIEMMQRVPDKVRALIFEQDWPEDRRFWTTPVFRIWQTLFTVAPEPLRRQLLQSRERKIAIRKLLVALPASDRPAFIAWLAPMINRPVKLWMEEMQSRITELRAIYSSPTPQVAALYAVLFDQGLKPTPNLADAEKFMEEVKQEIENDPIISPALKAEIEKAPQPVIPRDLVEEVEKWEEEQWIKAEEEKGKAREEAAEEKAAREEAGETPESLEEESTTEADRTAREKKTTETEETEIQPTSEGEATEEPPERPSWKEEQTLMQDTTYLETGTTYEAQLDFVVYCLRTGKVPWWAASWSNQSLNSILESLVSTRSKTVIATLQEILLEPRSEAAIEQVTQRLIAGVSEPLLQTLVRQVLPDLSGFIETITLAFTRYAESARQFSLPVIARINEFRWKPVIMALVGRSTAALESPTFLARAISVMAKSLGRRVEQVQREIAEIANEAVEEGETRFTPLVVMLRPGALPTLPQEPEIPDAPATTTEKTLEQEAETPGITPERTPEEEDEAAEVPVTEEIPETGEETVIPDQETAEIPESAEEVVEVEEPEEPDFQTEEWEPLEIVSYFIRHGSLPQTVALSQSSFEKAVEELFQAPPPKTGEILVELMESRGSRMRMVRMLTPEMIKQLVELALPFQADALAEMFTYWYPIFKRSGAPFKVELVWEQLLHYVATRPTGSLDLARFLKNQLVYLSRVGRKPLLTIAQWIQEQIDSGTLPMPAGLVRAFTQLRKNIEKNAARLQALDSDQSKKDAEPEEGEELYVKTAGLVLLHPFLNFFFEKLGLVKDKEWVSDESQRRGALLLHYVCTKQNSVPEFMLPLNKILCGMEFDEPLDFEFDLTEQEIEFTEALLEAVVNRWTALKSTSPDGLRGAFLIREGKLTFNGTRWTLKVESKPFDLLLDKLTWSINIIKLPWMESVLMVEWR